MMERKKVTLQAKVEELEAQNNKIAIKNKIIQEQYEKLFRILHEARQTQSYELIAPMIVAPHGYPPTQSFTCL